MPNEQSTDHSSGTLGGRLYQDKELDREWSVRRGEFRTTRHPIWWWIYHTSRLQVRSIWWETSLLNSWWEKESESTIITNQLWQCTDLRWWYGQDQNQQSSPRRCLRREHCARLDHDGSRIVSRIIDCCVLPRVAHVAFVFEISHSKGDLNQSIHFRSVAIGNLSSTWSNWRYSFNIDRKSQCLSYWRTRTTSKDTHLCSHVH